MLSKQYICKISDDTIFCSISTRIFHLSVNLDETRLRQLPVWTILLETLVPDIHTDIDIDIHIQTDVDIDVDIDIDIDIDINSPAQNQ